MKFIEDLILKYNKFRERKKITAQEKRIHKEEERKKYCLDIYKAYHNADKLSREEILKVFWKLLEDAGYEVSQFDSNTSTYEPAKQSWDWRDLGGVQFAIETEEIFGFSRNDITKEEYDHAKTFGELADLVIRKAKEKKLNTTSHEQRSDG